MLSSSWVEALVPAELELAHFNARRTGGAAAAPQRVDNSAWWGLHEPSRPDSAYYNRAVARAAVDLASLPAGIVAVELLPAQLDGAVAASLLGAGFAPAYTSCYLACTAVAQQPVTTTVERLGSSDTELFLDVLAAQGVPFPPERREAKRGFYCNDSFRAYLLRADDGSVAAAATAFFGATAVYLGNAFTQPAHRGRGAQQALLVARLNDAAAAGRALVYTDVEHGSTSHRNCERAGFRTLSINTVWRRRAAA